MRRFNFDEEGDEFHEEAEYMFEFEDDDEPYIKNEIMSVLQLDAIEHNLNIKLLSIAIKVAEGTFGWRFISLKRKIKLIKNAYYELDELIAEKSSEIIMDVIREEKEEEDDDSEI